MAQYRRIADTYTAALWRRLGDMPGDKPLLANGDGRIVKAYHRDDVDGSRPCKTCGALMSDHGWVPPPEPPPDPALAGHTVDPVSGKLVAPPPPPVPSEYPQTFVKVNAPNVIAQNQAEAEMAAAEGYSRSATELEAIEDAKAAASTAQESSAPTSSAKTDAQSDPDRGDLEGIAVCPGYYLVRNDKTGEYSTEAGDAFGYKYAKV
jgi:hypothetical protein